MFNTLDNILKAFTKIQARLNKYAEAQKTEAARQQMLAAVAKEAEEVAIDNYARAQAISANIDKLLAV